jgi:hypothetical protein
VENKAGEIIEGGLWYYRVELTMEVNFKAGGERTYMSLY